MERENNITFIHILGALLVMVGHQAIMLGQVPISILGLSAHSLGVHTLFMISGYLVIQSYERTNSRIVYLWKRLARLYPALFVCLILTAIVMRFFTVQGVGYWNEAFIYVRNNLFMHTRYNISDALTNNYYAGVVNGSIWTLPVEIACYFLLIIVADIFKLIDKINKYLSKGIYVVILLVLGWAKYYTELVLLANGKSLVFLGTEWYSAVSLTFWFLIGVGFYFLNLSKFCNWQIAALIFIIYSVLGNEVKYYLAPYVVAFMIMCFALAKNPIYKNWFKGKDICYGLYLYAFPVQQICINIIMIRLGLNVSIYVVLIIAMIITTGLAFLSFYFIEVPCDKFLTKIRIKLFKK